MASPAANAIRASVAAGAYGARSAAAGGGRSARTGAAAALRPYT